MLPLLISDGGAPELFEVPADAVLEVDLRPPDPRVVRRAAAALARRARDQQHAAAIGGITYPAAPFNGWYLDTEIGARNLADADRYDLLPVIAARMGLDTSSPATLWKDRALVELVRRCSTRSTGRG